MEDGRPGILTGWVYPHDAEAEGDPRTPVHDHIINVLHKVEVDDDDAPARSETYKRHTGHLRSVIDQLTEDEATALLEWLAEHKPDAFRSALRTSAGWAPRIHALYVGEGRPHS
jgi:hypothetical protein